MFSAWSRPPGWGAMLATPQVAWAALPMGDAGTARTLDAMEQEVRAATRDPLVVQTARRIVARVPERDTRAEAEAIFRWLQAHLRYTRDPTDYELLVPPPRFLREIQAHGTAVEDCDSAAMALAALLQAIGIRTRFRVLGAQPPRGADSRFSHVYVEALVDGAWFALDPTIRGRPPGFRPAGRGREAVYEEGAMHYTLGQTPETTQVPTGGILRDISAFISTAAREVLPLAERYGLLRPVVGPARLPLPGEPTAMYAPTALREVTRAAAAAAAPMTPWLLGGAAVLGLLLFMPRGRR